MPGEVIPLRPLTVSELLDAAVELLRRNVLGLLPVAAVLALLEQAALYPLRSAAAATSVAYLPVSVRQPVAYWLLVATGFATEGAAIAVLGGLAGRASVPALVDGAPAPPWLLGRASRIGPLLVLAVAVGIGAAASTLVGFLAAHASGVDGIGAAALIWLAALLPWTVWYLFSGLAAPALVIERRAAHAALGRSFVLVIRGRQRPGFIRLLGYLAWLAVRLALAAGSVAALRALVPLPGPIWPAVLNALAWAGVNTIAYAALGCLDAVLYLENRMRVEGLDLALGRALRRGVRPEQVLAG